MRNMLLSVTAASLSLAGCSAATTPSPEDMPAMPAGECKAEAAQDMIGRKATAEVGAELLRRTGARQLRWVPPRSAVTMDYRADRLTVGYDDTYTIVRISCG
ncbi:I78 family peptidase inhibitor [Novosphingobium sp. MMS21-SN21R]|uniref:I78 family peptidase inhibitor n=1 Tax=Novosphingobium sp. MMS21-SN21R TaxID=2969298 RepID=UPI002885B6F4|nr:I78 family peptidase inhibitor [Novosphingobium sp. MMS21-SN21R]MDT0507198.1 I78 family peptidase inhibitor [Novosphingobium sp. MMS21-SN21R]